MSGPDITIERPGSDAVWCGTCEAYSDDVGNGPSCGHQPTYFCTPFPHASDCPDPEQCQGGPEAWAALEAEVWGEVLEEYVARPHGTDWTDDEAHERYDDKLIVRWARLIVDDETYGPSVRARCAHILEPTADTPTPPSTVEPEEAPTVSAPNTIAERHRGKVSAISPEVLEHCNVRTEHRGEIGPGLVFPYRQNGTVIDVFRPDHPGEGPRYLWPKGQSLIFNVITTEGGTVAIVEGTRQALAFASWAPAGVETWGMNGCRGWNTRENGRGVPNPELDRVKGRHVLLSFDADRHTNPNVYEAARKLRDECLERAALSVRFIDAGGEGTDGVDDLLDGIDEDKRALWLLSRIDGATEELGDPPPRKDEAPSLFMTGDAFVLDQPEGIPAVWGRDSEVLWAEGEPFELVAPPGVGKTTVMGQVVAGLLGLRTEVLGYPVTSARRVLYLASDRPRQIGRSLRRQFGPEDRDVLNERLVIWRGPPPADFAQYPEKLVEMCREADASHVVLDSLKDMAVGLSDDTVGSGLNRAMQLVVAAGIELAATHHQRKGQNGVKPKTLEDVYGSTWITAGAGWVVLLWGQAGDLLVDLIHLKQPAETIGPLKLEHDHHAGLTTVHQGTDALALLRRRKQLTTTDLARVMFDKPSGTVTPNERLKAARQLNKLVRAGLAEIEADASKGGDGGRSAAIYRPSDGSGGTL
jgi:replicative DNA helicase